MRCNAKEARAAPQKGAPPLPALYTLAKRQPAAVPGRVKRIFLSVLSEAVWCSMPYQKDAARNGKKPVYGRRDR